MSWCFICNCLSDLKNTSDKSLLLSLWLLPILIYITMLEKKKTKLIYFIYIILFNDRNIIYYFFYIFFYII
jgi:hypothetical protein